MQQFILFPVGNLNVELMNIVHMEDGVGRVGVRLFVGNRGSGQVGSTFRRVGSGPRKVTRGQLSDNKRVTGPNLHGHHARLNSLPWRW